MSACILSINTNNQPEKLALYEMTSYSMRSKGDNTTEAMATLTVTSASSSWRIGQHKNSN